MAYYSTFDWEAVEEPIIINPKKKDEMERFFLDSKNNNINNNISGFKNVKIEIDRNGNFIGIVLDEYYAEFYDDELFAKKLFKIVENGKIRLFFNNEYNEFWGYEVSPSKVEPLVKLIITQSEYEKVFGVSKI